VADKLQMTFTGGELSPQAHGRVDLAKYQSGLKTLRNFYVHPIGGVVNRPGTEFVGYTKEQDYPVREIPFEYNADQQYVLEFGNEYMRIKKDGVYIQDKDETAVLGIDIVVYVPSSGPVEWLLTINATGHGYAEGDTVCFQEVVGTSELNGRCFTVEYYDANNFKLKDPGGDYPTDGPYSEYVSGGKMKTITTIETPYIRNDEIDDLANLTYDQSADVLTVCVGGRWWPREITRGAEGHYDFNMSLISFKPLISAPTISEVNQRYEWSISSMETSSAGHLLNWPDANERLPWSIIGIGTRITIDDIETNPPGGDYETKLNGNSFIILSKDTSDKNLRLANLDGTPLDSSGWSTGTYVANTGRIYQNGPLRFRVTAVSPKGEESLSSPYGEKPHFIDSIPSSRYFAQVKYTPPPGEDVDHYNFYRMQQGIYGFVGTWDEFPYFAQNIEPDLTDVAPPEEAQNPFAELEDANNISGLTNTNPVRVETRVAHGYLDKDVVYMNRCYATSEISTITKAEQAVLTTVGNHNLDNGVAVHITDVSGMTEVNDTTYYVAEKTASTFKLSNITGDIIKSLNFGASGTGGLLKATTVELNRDYFQVEVVSDTEFDLYDFNGEATDIDAFGNFATPTITGITKANPALVTAAKHGLKDGDKIYIEDVLGMTEINDMFYVVHAADTDTFKLRDTDRSNVNSAGYTTYISGGTIYPGVVHRCDPQHYPGTVSFHEQRRLFGRSDKHRQRVWGTQIGNIYNMNETRPRKADDSLQFDLVATRANEIRHLVSMQKLFIFTSGGEWVSDSGDAGYIPENIRNRPHSTNGTSVNPRPLQIGSTILYVQEMGNSIWDLRYSFEADSYGGNEISIMAEHLFEGVQIVDWAYQRVPGHIVWCVLSDGTMAALTYLPEHRIWGWSRHDTDGEYESVTTINEGDESVVYVTVKRTLNGKIRRVSERFHTRTFSDVRDCHFVDCGLKLDNPILVDNIVTQTNPDVNHIRALSHGLTEGDLVDISDVVGKTELNDNQYVVVAETTDSFELASPFTGDHNTILNIAQAGPTDPAIVTFGQLGASKPMEDISTSAGGQPGVVTATAHGFENDEVVYIEDVVGMTEVNDTVFVVANKTDDTFELNKITGGVEDTSGYAGYDSGGTVKKCTAVHTLADGDYIKIVNVDGVTDPVSGESLVNRHYFTVNNSTTHTFELQTWAGLDVDISGQDPYIGDGRTEGVTRIELEAMSPYVEGGLIREAFETVSGLAHLEGETVSILANGNVEPQQVVANGKVTLPSGAAGRIHIGVPYESQLESLDVGDVQGQLAGKMKNMSKAIFRLYRTRSLHAGPSLNKLSLLKEREFEDYNEPTAFQTGEYHLVVDPEWNYAGSIAVQQSDPLPVTIQSVGFDVDISNI